MPWMRTLQLRWWMLHERQGAIRGAAAIGGGGATRASYPAGGALAPAWRTAHGRSSRCNAGGRPPYTAPQPYPRIPELPWETEVQAGAVARSTSYACNPAAQERRASQDRTRAARPFEYRDHARSLLPRAA